MIGENAFESAVCDALSRCSHGGVMLAAVSGGADSTAMLIAAAAARERLGFVLHCLHVDHGIRPEDECEADASAVRALCASLTVPCRVFSVKRGAILERGREKGCGIEAAAREYRHAAWTEEARRVGAHRVLVGHTADDLLETALLRFLRGAGPAGLAAMAEERGLVFRPLLSRSRAEVHEYLASKGVAFQTDSTNADPSYFRNRVRLSLVPLLDEKFPHWRGAVASLVRTQAEAAAFIAQESAARIGWEEKSEGTAVLSTDERFFFSQPDIVRQEALYAAVDRLISSFPEEVDEDGMADPAQHRAMEPRRTAIRGFTAGTTGAVDLGAYRAARRGGRIVVERIPSAYSERGFSIVIEGSGTYRVAPFSLTAIETVPADGDLEEADREGLTLNKGDSDREGFRPVLVEDRIFIGGHLVSALRKASARKPSCAVDIVVAEDGEGIAAVFFIGLDGEMNLLRRDRRNGNADYAQSVFFSILL
jgi:tRNA(Ile)-lysidine synthase